MLGQSLHFPELPLSSTGMRRHFWMPAADVYETAHGWIVKLELAGVRPQEIEVTVQGSLLRIGGRRRDWIVHETRCCRSWRFVTNGSSGCLSCPKNCNMERFRRNIATECCW